MIKSILFLCIVSVVSLLGSNNPKIYAMLGDKLFNANEKLSFLLKYDTLKPKLLLYKKNSNDLKEKGFELDRDTKKNSTDKKNYLKELRELDKQYQRLLFEVQGQTMSYIKNNHYKPFSYIVGLDITDFLDGPTFRDNVFIYYSRNSKKGKIPVLDKILVDRKNTNIKNNKNDTKYYKQKIPLVLTGRIPRTRIEFKRVYSTKIVDLQPQDSVGSFEIKNKGEMHIWVKLFNLTKQKTYKIQCVMTDNKGHTKLNAGGTFKPKSTFQVSVCSTKINTIIDSPGIWRVRIKLNKTIFLDESIEVKFKN